MSYANTVISLKNGEKFHCMEYPAKVAELVDTLCSAESGSKLVRLESPAVPTGQYFYVDVTEIASIRTSR